MKKKSAFSHFAVIASGSFMNILVGVLTTPIITRLVDPISYGQFSIFSLYENIGVMIFCLGMDQTLIRYFYTKDELIYKRTLLWKCLLYPIVSLLLLSAVFILLIVFKVVDFEFNLYVTIALVVLIAITVLNRFSSLLLRLTYFTKLFSTLLVSRKAIYALVASALAYYVGSHYFEILIFATLLSIAITTTVCVVKNRNLWFGEIESSLIPPRNELFKYGFPFILSMGIVAVFQSVSQFTLKAYTNYGQVGTFAAAMTLVHIFAILQSGVNMLWSPMATEHFEKHPDDKSFYIKGNSYITIVMFIFGITAIAFKDVLALLLGERFRDASYLFPCLIFIPIMYTISETTVMGINFSKKSHFHIWSAVVSLFVSLIVNLLLIPSYGAKGAAIASAISYIAFFTTRSYFAQKCYPIDFNFIKIYVVTFVVFVYAIVNTINSSLLYNLLGCILSMIATLAIYRRESLEVVSYAYTSAKKMFSRTYNSF